MRILLPDPGPGPLRAAFDTLRRVFLSTVTTQEAVPQVLLQASGGGVWRVSVSDAGILTTTLVQGP